jgi:hypothetical protein
MSVLTGSMTRFSAALDGCRAAGSVYIISLALELARPKANIRRVYYHSYHPENLPPFQSSMALGHISENAAGADARRPRIQNEWPHLIQAVSLPIANPNVGDTPDRPEMFGFVGNHTRGVDGRTDRAGVKQSLAPQETRTNELANREFA